LLSPRSRFHSSYSCAARLYVCVCLSVCVYDLNGPRHLDFGQPDKKKNNNHKKVSQVSSAFYRIVERRTNNDLTHHLDDDQWKLFVEVAQVKVLPTLPCTLLQNKSLDSPFVDVSSPLLLLLFFCFVVLCFIWQSCAARLHLSHVVDDHKLFNRQTDRQTLTDMGASLPWVDKAASTVLRHARIQTIQTTYALIFHAHAYRHTGHGHRMILHVQMQPLTRQALDVQLTASRNCMEFLKFLKFCWPTPSLMDLYDHNVWSNSHRRYWV